LKRFSSGGVRGSGPLLSSGNFEATWIVEFWNGVSFASVAKPAAKTGCLDFHVRIAAFAVRAADAE
jgi:hypothetical protein